jgi:hypothetical protein
MNHPVLYSTAVGVGLFLLTVTIPIMGLMVLIWVMRRRTRHLRRLVYVLEQMGVILGVALGLFAMHALQILGYTFTYLWVDAFDDFETALYFSTSTFTTVGYGEIFIEGPWRLVAAIQSANGFLALGWSTIFLLSVLT